MQVLIADCLTVSIQVVSLNEQAYTDFILSTWVATLSLSMFCILAQIAVFVLPLRFMREKFGFDHNEAKRIRTYLLGAVTLVVTVSVLIWVIRLSTTHRDIVDDLAKQLLESMDSFMGIAVDDSFKMVKQGTYLPVCMVSNVPEATCK